MIEEDMKEKRQRLDAQERKKSIMDNVRRLIRQSSYDELRLENLLREMDLSKGGFYHHFKSKNELLVALIREDVAVHLELIRSAEQEFSALDGLVTVLQVGSSHLSGDQGVLVDIKSLESRRIYLDILENEFNQPMTDVIHRNFERGVVQKEYRDHNSKHLADLFAAVNVYGNRRAILRDWSDQQNLEFSIFALSLLSEQLGVGDRLITLLKNKK